MSIIVLQREELEQLLEAAIARALSLTRPPSDIPEVLTVADFARLMQCSDNTARSTMAQLEQIQNMKYITRLGREYRMTREAFERMKRDFEGKKIPTEEMTVDSRRRLALSGKGA